jgi:hypothetical protein
VHGMTDKSETPREAARRLASFMLEKGYLPEALHEYTDREGNVLYWKIRLKHPVTGEKWIRPMKWDGASYVLGEPTFLSGKPLYNLHQLHQRPNEVVYLTEGEKCADELGKRGLLATTSGAADSVDKADFRSLAGRDIIISPDNDESGQRYADDATLKLLQMKCNVMRIAIGDLGLPLKGDCADWLAANPAATSADILALPVVSTHYHQYGEWTQPQPLIMKIEQEPYPLDAFPKDLREAVQEVAAFVKAPVSMIASSALAALSLAIQAHVDIKRAEKLSGPSGLFLLTVADSGERKSTCDGFFFTAIRSYEAAQAKDAQPALMDYQAKLKTWEAKRNGILEGIKQSSKRGNPTKGLETTLQELQKEQPKAPRIPRLLYADATPEALTFSLGKQWPSGGVVSAEAGIVLGSHGMGKDSVMRNLAMMNQLWDGNDLTIDRKTTDSYTVHGARLTIALQVQEPTLREFFVRSGVLARGTGFLARFLLSWPISTQGLRPFTEAPDEWPHLAAFNKRLTAVLNEPITLDEAGALTPRMLTLTPEAKNAWIEYHNEIETELISGGELHEVRDVASKSADNAARLAAIFHKFMDGKDETVSQECFEAASRITLWHLNEALRFFNELALPEELVAAIKLDNWLSSYCRKENTNLVPMAKLQRCGPHGLRHKAIIEHTLKELEELGRARLVQEGQKIMIAINPTLLGNENAS